MALLTSDHLAKLCEMNEFKIEPDKMVIVGLRGCTPTEPNKNHFDVGHPIAESDVDMIHPRCTLIQWRPSERQFAVFPASTVPHKQYVEKALAGKLKANMLVTGYYHSYRKGTHRKGAASGHNALVQVADMSFRRTYDDSDYDTADEVFFATPGDNIHAAFCQALDSNVYHSAGCQVVVGYPQCASRGNKPAIGPWKRFKDGLDSTSQKNFSYVLLSGREAQRAANGNNSMERVRLGSQGDRALKVQKALESHGYFNGDVDGKFQVDSLRALLDFQTDYFGPTSDDGIVGPVTAEALEIAWP